MRPLTCPIPSNINPLQSNGFVFTITKLPELQYFCQEVNIPDISLPVAETNSPLSKVPYAGDKLDFGNLTIQFTIDETMTNYIAIYKWLIGLGFPELHQQYQDFLDTFMNSLTTTPAMASYSDATLAILNSANNIIQTIRFVDLLPISLNSVLLQSNNNDTTYLMGVATFDYNYYYFT